MALTHISNPINEVLNRIQGIVEKNDNIVKNINTIVENIELNEIEKPKILLSEDETAALLSIETKKLKSLRYQHRSPQFYKIGNVIRYHYNDVIDYLNAARR